ncbi:PRC-barrel domain-containing protein [Flavobacterium micromati]|uniref:PRC-barrel domain-containing protein n=1 Tax=Flavobacterium micromati TaxID=229205 RepID=A0A1M5N2Y8_9FLAO|nr:PRC-barrel domain-containing protein [Flavobacterium micromati]SHG83956.1 PRC-barrel domain-containing protein [Flavobacterium micromati]
MKQSVNSLLGFSINGTDGEIGKVEEFYFDDQTSTVRYIVVKTGGWLSEKKVLISPEAF